MIQLVLDSRLILKDTLKSLQNSKNIFTYNSFRNEILNKDGLGKEREEVYHANKFLKCAFDFCKGRIDNDSVDGFLDCLIGYEFNVYLYKVFKNHNIEDISIELPVENKTFIDVAGQFKHDTEISFLKKVNPDLSQEVTTIPKGYNSFEAKAVEKVTNNCLKDQLKIAKHSKLFSNSFGVILDDTAISGDVIIELERIGCQIIRSTNMTKQKLIDNVLNIFNI